MSPKHTLFISCLAPKCDFLATVQDKVCNLHKFALDMKNFIDWVVANPDSDIQVIQEMALALKSKLERRTW